MNGFQPTDFKQHFNDNEACLEWLKNKLYPEGITCPVCQKVTKHHKLARRHCYCCDACGNQVYPTSGTIFYRSSIPLKTWFEVISKMSESEPRISVKDIQREYGMTYKTAWRMATKIKEFLYINNFLPDSKYFPNPAPAVNDPHLDNNLKTPGSKSIIKSKFNSTQQLSFDIPSSGRIKPNENARQAYNKRDRTARLLREQILLWQSPQGLHVKEIAQKCSISERTAYRDLKALESELGSPIWEKGSRRGIAEDSFMPPINITFAEAITMFMAVRLTQNFFNAFDPNIASIFMKLNAIVPMPLKNEIQHILEYMEKLQSDTRKLNNISKLFQAWLTQHKVKFTYQGMDERESSEWIIEPYFIEPSVLGGSSYVIAYCNLKKNICAYKTKRIIGDVTILPETYKIPEDFNAIEYLDTALGIQIEKEIQTIKLHFNARISKFVKDDYCHPSRMIELQKDGSIIMTLKVHDDMHVRNWIMGYGDEVEILEPEYLRKSIGQISQSIADIYNKP